jgi:sugar phosphate isomerase/epimerase
MRLGYNTNGFAHHELCQAIDVLAEIGYCSVAITLDHHSLNPYDGHLAEQLRAVRARLARYTMASVVETGARFLLDPRHKHEPTLVSPLERDRERRIDFLRRAIDVAYELGSECVSFWSGAVHDGAGDDEVWIRLLSGLRPVLEYAERRGVRLGFEPEPGMFIDTMSRYTELLSRLDAPHFQLTLDVGHLHCLREWPVEECISQWSPRIVNVHIEDMRAGVHEHLMFGEGEMDFDRILRSFASLGYRGGLHVELSRHSHEAPAAARRAFDYLVAHMPKGRG